MKALKLEKLIKRSTAKIDGKSLCINSNTPCTKCIAHLYLRLAVVLVQMQSVWDRFETESSTRSD